LADLVPASGYLHGEKPTSIDAAIYGFIANIYFYDIDTPLKQFVSSHANLVRHCTAIHAAVTAPPELPRQYSNTLFRSCPRAPAALAPGLDSRFRGNERNFAVRSACLLDLRDSRMADRCCGKPPHVLRCQQEVHQCPTSHIRSSATTTAGRTWST